MRTTRSRSTTCRFSPPEAPRDSRPHLRRPWTNRFARRAADAAHDAAHHEGSISRCLRRLWQELNRVLCDNLEEKMKGTVVDGRIAKLFEGKLKNYISCINVEFESSRIEEFKDLSLNVKGCATLYDAFEKCPCPHIRRGWWLTAHICTGTRLVPPTSAPGLGSPLPTSAPGLGSRLRSASRYLPPLFPDATLAGGDRAAVNQRTGMPKRRGWRATTSTWRRGTGSKMPPRVSSSQSSRLCCTFRQAARLKTPPARPLCERGPAVHRERTARAVKPTAQLRRHSNVRCVQAPPCTQWWREWRPWPALPCS